METRRGACKGEGGGGGEGREERGGSVEGRDGKTHG